GDLGSDARGIGTYLFGQPPNGPGIRPNPYSTDFGVNNRTYSALPGLAVPHGVGFLWATMVWEMNWELIANGSQSGLDPDIFNGTGGNNLTTQLVMDGMKLQPCSPGFVDGRNAILQADVNLTGGANQCVIWAAFARRGLGFSASQGSSGSTGDGTEAFDMPPSCDFIDPTPTSQDVCVGNDAVYTFNVNSGFTTPPVTMSATGNPAGSSVAFSPNPVPGPMPNSSTMTVSSIGAGAVGNHTITINGVDGGANSGSSDVALNVFPNTLSTPVLTTPSNGTTGASIYPELIWNAVTGADNYFIEVATDMAFTNIVYTANSSSNSHTVDTALTALTTYYWRVTADNICTTSAASTTFSFTTANIIQAIACASPALPIPDNTPAGVSSTINVPSGGSIMDMNVAITA
ncbi:MAG TPA: M36 family metallopeptidase, partial [Anaerolineae bacterium]|nr:M36 family metallopeptidase [Anaerolineae bacterium]